MSVSESNQQLAQDFDQRLAGFLRCTFEVWDERRDIEELVQEYIDRPALHTRNRTAAILGHLLESEVAPTARVARTGIDPAGFLIGSFPRAGRWVSYALFVTLWTVALFRARHTGDYSLVVVLGLASAWVAHRWWECMRVMKALEWPVLRELRDACYDPATIRDRLWRLEAQGFRPHSNAYALLRIDEQLRSVA